MLINIHYAVHQNNVVAIELLIHNGANIFEKDNTGKMIIEHAIERFCDPNLYLYASTPYTEIVKKMMEEYLSKDTPEKFSSNDNLVKLLNILIQKKESVEFMKKLISHIDFSIQSNIKELPLHHAAKMGNIDVLKLILDKTVNQINQFSQGIHFGETSPLHIAVFLRKFRRSKITNSAWCGL